MEGRGFRDRTPEFEAANAVILGISYDTAEDNTAFAQEEGFPYPLLCDTDRTVGQAYGAAKGPDEDWPDFPKRITYLIDPEGRIARGWEVSDVKAHPDEVLGELRARAG